MPFHKGSVLIQKSNFYTSGYVGNKNNLKRQFGEFFWYNYILSQHHRLTLPYVKLSWRYIWANVCTVLVFNLLQRRFISIFVDNALTNKLINCHINIHVGGHRWHKRWVNVYTNLFDVLLQTSTHFSFDRQKMMIFSPIV